MEIDIGSKSKIGRYKRININCQVYGGSLLVSYKTSASPSAPCGFMVVDPGDEPAAAVQSFVVAAVIAQFSLSIGHCIEQQIEQLAHCFEQHTTARPLITLFSCISSHDCFSLTDLDIKPSVLAPYELTVVDVGSRQCSSNSSKKFKSRQRADRFTNSLSPPCVILGPSTQLEVFVYFSKCQKFQQKLRESAARTKAGGRLAPSSPRSLFSKYQTSASAPIRGAP
ncbi:hypothetical protein EVAR_10806_1 [Eumeta japonica]|uniref:Uncharacterized protein n=1 Tax=Eumeta variegata TaxID=151549 RepID=A0A4C1Y8F2_EUMVA|nr:hypothetical protein EVAR_10806_1 [Eumeta japonica]